VPAIFIVGIYTATPSDRKGLLAVMTASNLPALPEAATRIVGDFLATVSFAVIHGRSAFPPINGGNHAQPAWIRDLLLVRDSAEHIAGRDNLSSLLEQQLGSLQWRACGTTVTLTAEGIAVVDALTHPIINWPASA
jgi:hypothetical protein